MRRALALLLCGCSYVFVSGPPPNHAQLESFDCTASRFVPALDLATSVVFALNFLAAAKDSESEWNDTFAGDPPFPRMAGLGLYSVLATVSALAFAHGVSETSACIDAKQALAARPPVVPRRPVPAAAPAVTPDAGVEPDAAEPDAVTPDSAPVPTP